MGTGGKLGPPTCPFKCFVLLEFEDLQGRTYMQSIHASSLTWNLERYTNTTMLYSPLQCLFTLLIKV